MHDTTPNIVVLFLETCTERAENALLDISKAPSLSLKEAESALKNIY